MPWKALPCLQLACARSVAQDPTYLPKREQHLLLGPLLLALPAPAPSATTSPILIVIPSCGARTQKTRTHAGMRALGDGVWRGQE